MIRAVLAAAAASLALVVPYLALGGEEPVARPPDPCASRSDAGPGSALGTVQRLALTAASGAACDLGVSRERLLLSLAGEAQLPAGATRERRTAAFRAGLRRAIDEEERAGRLGSAQAFLLRQAVEVLPVEALLERLFGPG